MVCGLFSVCLLPTSENEHYLYSVLSRSGPKATDPDQDFLPTSQLSLCDCDTACW